jgi:hypothetical protein
MTLLSQNVVKIEQFKNTTTTKLMTVDGVAANRTDTVKVTYKNEPLTITPESEVVRYLGFWTTPNGNMQSSMDLVFERTLKTKETIQGHPLDPKEAIEVFVVKGVGNFRYLATESWKRRVLDRLDRL